MKKLMTITALLLALSLFFAACGKNTVEPQPLTPDESQSLTPDEPKVTKPSGPIGNNAQMLTSDATFPVELVQTKKDRYDNGSYYFMDVAGENALRRINSCYQNSIREDETEEEYAQRRAVGMSMTLTPGNPYNLSVTEVEELSQSLGYPVYVVTFLTGSDLNATCWSVYLTRTEHYSYQYAFAATSQTNAELEEDIAEYFRTLKLAPLETA